MRLKKVLVELLDKPDNKWNDWVYMLLTYMEERAVSAVPALTPDRGRSQRR